MDVTIGWGFCVCDNLMCYRPPLAVMRNIIYPSWGRCDQYGYTALMKAASRGELEWATMLVDGGANLEAKSKVSDLKF